MKLNRVSAKKENQYVIYHKIRFTVCTAAISLGSRIKPI